MGSKFAGLRRVGCCSTPGARKGEHVCGGKNGKGGAGNGMALVGNTAVGDATAQAEAVATLSDVKGPAEEVKEAEAEQRRGVAEKMDISKLSLTCFRLYYISLCFLPVALYYAMYLIPRSVILSVSIQYDSPHGIIREDLLAR